MLSKFIPLPQSLLFFICNLLFSHTAIADIDELYHLSIGGNIERYNTKLAINADETSGVELEDTLGLDKKVNAGWISGGYRVGDLHRLRLTYTPIKRTSIIESNKDIILDNTTIKAGASISSKVDTEIVDFSYIYSLHKTPQLELGVSAGLYWLFISTTILAAGEIIPEGGDQPEFKADYLSEQKLQAPMPLLGMSVNYEITPSWRTHAALRYLSLQLNEINGRILSVEFGTEYYFNNNWGLGLSLSSFSLDVEIQRLVTNTTLNWSHNGVQIYAVFKY